MTRALSYLAFVAAVGLGCSPGSPAAPNESAAAAAAPAVNAPAASEPAAAPAAPAAESSAPDAPRGLTPNQPATDTAAKAPLRGGEAGPTAPEPAAPARLREVTIPSDTPLTVTLQSAIGSETSTVEDPVRGELSRPIIVGGRTIVPAGAEVRGSVIAAERSGRVKGRATVAFRFDHLVVNGERYAIRTARVTREAESSTGSDVKKGGIGAAAGAIIGGLAGGGKGAAIGAGVGGTGAVLATRGKEVHLPAGTTVRTHLEQALTVTVESR